MLRVFPKMSREDIRPTLGILLDQILVFPMVVVILVSLTLLFGGRCALWQWWGAVAVVLALPFWRNDWKSALWANLWFLITLFVIWVLSGISVTKVLTDCHSYHYPAMRMLMLGWNPILDSTCEAVNQIYTQICGGQSDDFWMWPVFSMPRPVWYFSAVAAFFTNNQFDLYHVIVMFFWGSAIGLMWKAFQISVLLKIVLAIFIVNVTYSYPFAVDMVMSLATLGLLLCFYIYFKRHVCLFVPMVTSSFWMCSAKQTGIVFCVISWSCFLACVLIQERRNLRENIVRYAKIGGVIAALFLTANISPYITSSVQYSHPFYPQFTFDENRFPVVNFTKDFHDINDDAKAMSNRLAMFLNAYVCPETVRNYYAYKLSRPNFMPYGRTWRYGGEEDGSVQLKSESRYWIMIPIVIMLVLGGFIERFVSVVMLLCAIALPTEMIGYLRYVTMLQFSFVFCIPLLCQMVENRRLAKIVYLCLLVLLAWGRLCTIANRELALVNDRLTIYESFGRGLPAEVYYNKDTWGHKASASLNLLNELTPKMDGVKFLMLPEEMLKGGKGDVQKRVRKHYSIFPDHSFLIPKWYHIERLSPAWRLSQKSQRPRGDWALMFYDFKMFWRLLAADIPRAIWLRITGQIDNHMKPSNECRVVTQIDACAESSDRFLRRWEINLSYIEADDADAKIVGTKQLRISYPNWMMKDGRQGAFVEGDELSGECELTFSSAGEVLFALKGVRINHKDAPPTLFYADYESFAINGKEMLEKPISVLGTMPHRVRCRVGKGETLKIATRLKPHRYERTVLRNMLLAISNFTFVTEDLVDQVLERPEMQQYLCEMSEEKNESK